MKVICAGPAKTGTKSISKALQILGLKVYNWEEQTFDFLDHWVDVFQNGAKPDVKYVYENADAVVDMPGKFFFEEILEAFPDCKVILSERDEHSWVESLVNQIKVFNTATFALKPLVVLSPTLKKLFFVLLAFTDAMFGSHDPKATYVFRKRFRSHNERVKAVVPSDKLLVYNIKQGWKPLCDFLECEIPNVPFPHENIKGEVANMPLEATRAGCQIKREFMRALLGICSLIVIFVAIVCYVYYGWDNAVIDFYVT